MGTSLMSRMHWHRGGLKYYCRGSDLRGGGFNWHGDRLCHRGGNAIEVAIADIDSLLVTDTGGQLHVHIIGSVATITGAIVLGNPTANAVDGIITATGNITFAAPTVTLQNDNFALHAGTDSTGTLTLPDAGLSNASGDLRLTGETDVVDVSGRVLGTLTADDLFFLSGAAGGDTTLTTDVATIDAELTAAANLNIDENSGIALVDVQTFDGSIDVDATVASAGDVRIIDVDAGDNGGGANDDVDIATTMATSDILFGDSANTLGLGLLEGNATASQNVILNATGAITDDDGTDNTDINALGADLDSTDEIGGTGATTVQIDTAVDTLTADSATAGDIGINETDGVTLTSVTTNDGAIDVDAGNAVIIQTVTAADTVAGDDHDANITTVAGNITFGSSGSFDGTVTADDEAILNAAAAIVDDDDADNVDVVAASADLDAGGAIGGTGGTVAQIDTTVGSITANTSAAGDIGLNETDAITLTSVTTNDGAIDVDAGGTVTIQTVTSGDATPGDTHDVAITTSANDIQFGDGAAIAGTVTADNDAILNAAGGIIDNDFGGDTTDIIATNEADLDATTGIGDAAAIDTQLASITVNNTTSGAINIAEESAGGALSITDATQGNNANVDELTITTAGGALTVAGAVNNQGDTNPDALVTLTSTGGALQIQSTVDSDAGDINLSSTDSSVTFTDAGDVTSVTGDVSVQATAASQVITMADLTVIDAGSGDIDMDANGTISLGQVTTTSAATTAVNIDSVAGAIVDNTTAETANVTASTGSAEVVLNSATGVGTSTAAGDIDTDILDLTADASASGGLFITETNNITLASLTTLGAVADDITVSGGTIEVETIDADSNNSGDNLARVTLTASGAITDTGNNSDVTAQDGVFVASTGIGVRVGGFDINTTLTTVDVETATGDIYITDTDDLVLDDLDTSGHSARISNLAGVDMQIVANGVLTINDVVQNDSNTGLTSLAASGGAATDTMAVNANVLTTGNNGGMELIAGGTITLAAGVTIDVGDGTGTSTGSIAMNAGRSYAGFIGGHTDTAEGDISMSATSSILGDEGGITLRATNDIALALVNANGDATGTVGNVVISADNDNDGTNFGDITDANAGSTNIIGDAGTLTAGGNIGVLLDTVLDDTGADFIELDLNSITLTLNNEADASGNGDIAIHDVSAGGTFTITSLTTPNNAGAGNTAYVYIQKDTGDLDGMALVNATSVDGNDHLALLAPGTVTAIDSLTIDTLRMEGADLVNGNSLTATNFLAKSAASEAFTAMDVANIDIAISGANTLAYTQDATTTTDLTITDLDATPDGFGLLTADGNITVTQDGAAGMGAIILDSVVQTDTTDDTVILDSTNDAVREATNDNTVDIITVDLTLNAATGIGSNTGALGQTQAIDTQVATLTADNSGNGHIQINELTAGGNLTIIQISQSANTGDNIIVETESGSITVQAAGGGIDATGAGAATGSVVLFADGGNAGDLIIDDTITSVSGVITMRADDDVTFSAAGDITSTSGDIEVTADFDNGGAASGALTMANGTIINAGSGLIDVNADEGIALGSVQTTNATASAVTIDSQQGAVTDAGDTDVDIVADSGTVVINAVTGVGNGNALETTIGTLDISNATSGNIQILETNGITINELSQATAGNIDLQSTTGTVTVAAGQAGVSAVGAGTILLLADGAAAGDLVINDTVISVSGDITLRADDDVTFSAAGDVTSTSGDVEVTADFDNGGGASGALTMVNGTVINAGSGLIDVNADEGIALGSVQTTNATASAVTIDSQEGAVTDAGDTDVDIVANSGTTVINAVTGVGSANALETTINIADISTSGAGNIGVNETNAITLADVDTANGSITVVAGGAITATDVVSTADNDANDISITSTGGAITVSVVNAGATAGDVTLDAQGGAITDGNGGAFNVTADNLLADAAGGIDLDTTINTLNASTSAAGAININETNAITLTDVDTSNGLITVTAGGAITATDVVSTTDADANDISITSTGGAIAVSVVNAGATAGDVTLDAQGGAITDGNGGTVNVTADNLLADAAGGIDLDTTINTLNASTSAAGAININETNAITLTDVDTSNGLITVTAGGAITATDVVSTTDADANDISITSTGGAIAVSVVNAGATAGDVTLDAQGGAITDGNGGTVNVTADNLLADALGGIDLDTTINTLNASTSAAGAININETNAITLTDVDTANGAITVTAGGAITATDVRSLTNADANDISLTTTSGDITVQLVSALTAGDLTIDTNAGSVNAIGGGTHITANELEIDATTGIGNSVALNTNSIDLLNVDTNNGNIDINNAAGSTVTINSMSTGTGNIDYDQTGNENLNLTSVTITNGDITITNTGGTNADILIENNAVVTNATASFTAGGSVDDINDDPDSIVNVTAGTVVINAGGNIGNPGILDTNASNLNLIASGNIRINNDGTVDIIGLSAGGILELFNAGNVTQSGTISVSGTTSLNVNNSNDITFTNTGNNFIGRVTVVNGDNVSLTDVNTLNLRTVDINGDFTTVATITDMVNDITAGGAINLGGNGTVRIRSNTVLLSNTNSINLNGTNIIGDAALQINTPFGVDLIIANNDGTNQIDGSVFSNFNGHLVIGGTIEPPTTPALSVGTEAITVNTDLITLASGANLRTSADITILGGNINLDINSVISAGGVGGNGAGTATDSDQVSLIAVGDSIAGFDSGPGDITGVAFPGTIEGAAILLVAANDIINANNLVIDANGGNLQTVVGSGNTPTFGILNATPIDATAATTSFLNQLAVGTGVGLNNLTFVQAQTLILGNLIGLEQIAFIDVGLFEEDLTLYGTIGQGIALSLAQCEEIEGCAPDVTETELDELIVGLEVRIDELERRLAEGAGRDQEQIEQLLAGYNVELENFNGYKIELEEFYSGQEDFDDGFGDEFGEDLSTVEISRLNNILSTVQDRITWLEELKANTDLRTQLSESTGLELTIEAIDEIIRATQQQIRFLERQIQQLLDGTQALIDDSVFVAEVGDITRSRFPVYGDTLISYDSYLNQAGSNWY